MPKYFLTIQEPTSWAQQKTAKQLFHDAENDEELIKMIAISLIHIFRDMKNMNAEKIFWLTSDHNIGDLLYPIQQADFNDFDELLAHMTTQLKNMQLPLEEIKENSAFMVMVEGNHLDETKLTLLTRSLCSSLVHITLESPETGIFVCSKALFDSDTQEVEIDQEKHSLLGYENPIKALS